MPRSMAFGKRFARCITSTCNSSVHVLGASTVDFEVGLAIAVVDVLSNVLGAGNTTLTGRLMVEVGTVRVSALRAASCVARKAVHHAELIVVGNRGADVSREG
jgi:hypothetical protein